MNTKEKIDGLTEIMEARRLRRKRRLFLVLPVALAWFAFGHYGDARVFYNASITCGLLLLVKAIWL